MAACDFPMVTEGLSDFINSPRNWQENGLRATPSGHKIEVQAVGKGKVNM